MFLLVVVPHYWSAGAYPGRDFSSAERLLTQARVLCLYLWQIVVPLPSHMPFYYDWLQPSRGLLHPWTTLPALVLLTALLAAGWWQRKQRPLFALGVLWFFAGHFMTSNVIGLELAYEHRNHFALAGALLAIGSLLVEAGQRLALRPALQGAILAVVLAGVAGATLQRSHDWRDKRNLSQAAAASAPGSARAWIQLCASELEAGGGPVPGNSRLDQAIAACSQGAQHVPDSLNSPALLLVLKTLRGDITPADWDAFRERMRSASKSWGNYRAPSLLIYRAEDGVKLDPVELLSVFRTQDQTTKLQPRELASIGTFILVHLRRPDDAMPYFLKALAAVPATDPFAGELHDELTRIGRQDLAQRISAANAARTLPSPNPVD